jgi:hypothetical protein
MPKSLQEKKRRNADQKITDQASNGQQRDRISRYNGNLYELFPPFTAEEEKGWSDIAIVRLDKIRAALAMVEEGTINLSDHSGEATVLASTAIDKYLELEEIIEREQAKNKRNEKRIEKLIQLKDKHRKRVKYLESIKQKDEKMTEARLLCKARAFGRLHRQYLKTIETNPNARDIEKLLAFDVQQQLPYLSLK